LLLGSATLLTPAAHAGPRRCAAAVARAGGKAPDRVELRACRKGGADGDAPLPEPGPRADRAGTDAASPAGLRRVRSGRHVEVLARDLRLVDTSRERLERIAERYFRATRRRLVVTGGTRTPLRQAELMFEKLRHGEDLLALYENKQAATEIRDAYRDGLQRGAPRKAQIRALREHIEAQIGRGIHVSRHLKSGAADVRSRDMTPAREQAFRAAVAEEAGVLLIDERASAEPHLHLSL
jgi:hypothetical protein